MPPTTSIVELLEAGLRAESLRQKAIANNMANLGTAGYRRLDVKFEQLLAKALASKGRVDLKKLEPVVYQPGETPVKPNGNDVSLETEVGQLVKNALRQKTYLRLLKKKYTQVEMAIRTNQ